MVTWDGSLNKLSNLLRLQRLKCKLWMGGAVHGDNVN